VRVEVETDQVQGLAMPRRFRLDAREIEIVETLDQWFGASVHPTPRPAVHRWRPARAAHCAFWRHSDGLCATSAALHSGAWGRLSFLVFPLSPWLWPFTAARLAEMAIDRQWDGTPVTATIAAAQNTEPDDQPSSRKAG
jgi:hypothetical protein